MSQTQKKKRKNRRPHQSQRSQRAEYQELSGETPRPVAVAAAERPPQPRRNSEPRRVMEPERRQEARRQSGDPESRRQSVDTESRRQSGETVSRRTDSARRREPSPRRRPEAPERRRQEMDRSAAVSSVQRTPRSRTTEPDDHGFARFCRQMRRRSRRLKRRLRDLRREEQARNFPESDALPVQWLLLGWNMLPMLGSTLLERTWGQRHLLFQRLGQLLPGTGRRSRHRLHPALFMAGGCALVALVLVCSIYTFGTTVTYDGEVIAHLASEAQAEEARTNLEQFTTRTLGETFTIDDSLIQYSSGLLKRQELVDPETYEEDLSKEIGLVTPAYCLYVDGTRIGATPYEGALEELLVRLKEDATTADTISCDFAENVEIRPEYVPSSDIMNLGYIAETLYSTKTAEVTYEVKKGDTWSQIANSHDLTSKELLALNPGYNIDKLSIGEVLTLSASVPYLTMTVVQQERYVEEINYDIEYTDTADLYKGDYKVTSKGAYGAADVMANVTYVNGEEMERTVLSSVTLKEPVTEQRLQGTKARPTWHPTGTFRWPVSGRITSRFGGRRSPGGIGSTNHKGIDIAAPRGTPVYAADGGTVSYAGWMSGYGYLVQINHGNGYVTYYGHNSSLTCSVGDHVYKGQQIARVGSTGNSTGNHCHFEVRVNGVARNPLNYLS